MMKLKCAARPGSGEKEKWGNSEVLCLFGNEVDVPDEDGALMADCPYWEVIETPKAPAPAGPEVDTSDDSEKRSRRGRKPKVVDSPTNSEDNSD